MPGGGIPWMTAVTAEAARKEMRRLQAMDKDAWDGRRNIAFNAPERRGAKPVAPALPNRPYPVFFIEPPCNPIGFRHDWFLPCLLYTSPSPRDRQKSRMPSSA